MLAPVLVTPPAEAPVSREEAKAHLRVSHADEDALIDGLIAAAVSHLDGWAGLLGRCMVTQTWRVDFYGWSLLRLPFPDVQAVVVRHRDALGVEQTVPGGSVYLEDGHVRFLSGWAAPALYAAGPAPVSVELTAGFGDAAAVPAALKAAILLHVGHLYAHREAVVSGDGVAEVPLAYAALVAPYRVVRL
jgi:uncharacterized phiE125 gp8 family phage protein